MNYLQNHIWCHDSIWGGAYSCRHLVSLSSYEEHDLKDWQNVISDTTEDFFSQKIYDRMKEVSDRMDHNLLVKYSTREISLVKNDVIDWLNANVADRPNPREGESSKGWCIPSKESRTNGSLDISFFFYRKNDAMAFIKHFSEYKKPVHYCQYFSDVRKRLNLTTGKYEVE